MKFAIPVALFAVSFALAHLSANETTAMCLWYGAMSILSGIGMLISCLIAAEDFS